MGSQEGRDQRHIQDDIQPDQGMHPCTDCDLYVSQSVNRRKKLQISPKQLPFRGAVFLSDREGRDRFGLCARQNPSQQHAFCLFYLLCGGVPAPRLCAAPHRNAHLLNAVINALFDNVVGAAHGVRCQICRDNQRFS